MEGKAFMICVAVIALAATAVQAEEQWYRTEMLFDEDSFNDQAFGTTFAAYGQYFAASKHVGNENSNYTIAIWESDDGGVWDPLEDITPSVGASHFTTLAMGGEFGGENMLLAAGHEDDSRVTIFKMVDGTDSFTEVETIVNKTNDAHIARHAMLWGTVNSNDEDVLLMSTGNNGDGGVLVYTWDGNSASFERYIRAEGNGYAGSRTFGRSISADPWSHYIAVGDSYTHSQDGAVYIYDIGNPTTVLVEWFNGSDPRDGRDQQFGASVALVNNTLAVGAPEYDNPDIDDDNVREGTGKVHVYQYINDSVGWQLKQMLEPEDYYHGHTGYEFGRNVHFFGGLLAISAPYYAAYNPPDDDANNDDNDPVGSAYGRVFLYEYEDEEWVLAEEFGPDGSMAGDTDMWTDAFGTTDRVSYSNGQFLVAVPGADQRDYSEVDDPVTDFFRAGTVTLWEYGEPPVDEDDDGTIASLAATSVGLSVFLSLFVFALQLMDEL